ncbi:MAG TPA: flagellar hook-associated protein FlgK [Pseudolabrys sp.]|nr:flagellar hook-associated protein FlgK [Pseudolabrys sp.]
MGLSQALAAAVSGLHANQAGLSIVAGNVANANTPGYTRKTINQVAVADSGVNIGVRVGDVQRQLDAFVQKQLRSENAGASYADLRSSFYDQLQQIYGQPGADTSLDSIFNNFTSALQALSASPDDNSARIGVVSSAQLLAQQLNSMSQSVESLREGAESGIANAVGSANDLMKQISALNTQIAQSNQNDTSKATLMDQRDNAIDQLSQILDINVVPGLHDQVSVYTGSGLLLVGDKPATLSFDARGTLDANAQWSADPTKRGVGTITLTSPNGTPVDLIETKAIRSGQLAAYLQLRDQDLVQAQNQLDAIASSMASALSDKTTTGTPVTGPPAGFDIDIGSVLEGNTFNVSYTDKLTNTQRQITFVRVDDPSVLPLTDAATANSNDKVVGIDFSGGMASVWSQISNALSTTGIAASNPSGTTLHLVDDGTSRVTITNASTTTTVTSFGTGDAQLPLFLDQSAAYTGSFRSSGVQSQGFASRITVNAALIADPSKLVTYGTVTTAGDSTRPNFILSQLTGSSLTFNPNSGIGTVNSPYSGTLDGFMRKVIQFQSDAASTASTLKQGQDVVLSSLQQRFADNSSVNIDTEMSNLLDLQTAYAANARVMSAVKQMLDTLMNM